MQDMFFIDSISLIPKSSDRNSSLKFILFLKNKEVEEINKVLSRVILLSPKQQKKWKKEYGDIINYALDLFVDDSNLVLKRISLDEEVLDLSHQLIISLQNALRSAEIILKSETKLNG